MYNEALAKGQPLFSLLQQHLHHPNINDVEVATLEQSYQVDSIPGWPGLRLDHEEALKKANLVLWGGAWTTGDVKSRTSSRWSLRINPSSSSWLLK